MAVKYFCDRCGKELDNEGIEFGTVRICARPNKESHWWQFCDDCLLSIERSMIKNISDYEKSEGK